MESNRNKNKYENTNKLAPLLVCGVKQGLRLKAKRDWDRREAIEAPEN
jgi:hypothetical protein